MRENLDRVIPYLLYRDVDAAMDWLATAFGFTEQRRVPDPNGRANHGEMTVPGGGTIMLGAPGDDYRNPKQLGAHTQLQFVVVGDVDAHFQRARDAGADILHGPEDQSYGTRAYMAEDLEGHRWHFNQPLD